MRIQTLLKRWPKDRYGLAAAIVFALVLIRHFVPYLDANEPGKLLLARTLIDPSFLKHDWMARLGTAGLDVALLFSALVAPLWLLLKDALAVALTARLLLWCLLLYSLAKFAREIEVKWHWFALGLGLWIWSGQSMAAGEWIFGGAEQKCLAYAFLILSLTSLLRCQMLRAGIFCGIAVWFHALVGGWGAIALTGALLVRFREYGRRRLLTFTLATAILSLPLAWAALRYLAPGGVTELSSRQGMDADALIVLFRNPHHLDPYFFLTSRKLLATGLFTICTFFVVPKALSTAKARLLLPFLAVLAVVFGCGIAARQFGLFGFLKFYPFRGADVLFPLVFWLVAPGFLIAQVRSLARRPVSHAAILLWQALGTVLIVVLLVGKTSQAVRLFPTNLTHFTHSWLRYPTKGESPFEEMTRWIREHTPKSATFIAPPCEEGFWLAAERALVVNFKAAPHNAAILEWRRRITRLNRDRQFHSVGFGICAELDQNFPALDLEQLKAIRDTYAADYYLTTRRREDLADRLIHQNAAYYLYHLSTLGDHPSTSPPA
jgi:hypothetical protein